MRQWLSIGALLMAFLAVSAPAHAQLRLAYVDVQRALNECDAGKRAKSEFQSKIQTLDSKLQREQNEVQGLKDEIEKKLRPQLTDKLIAELRTKTPVTMDEKYFDSAPPALASPVQTAPIVPK